MNRYQTEEWKGWMQIIFLMYHYFAAEPAYNIVRVLIDAYVWMTGFGNFSYFAAKNDFSFLRFVQMFWRLNFFVGLLCMVTNNTYILYYICPLHTFFFIFVYVVMYVGSRSRGREGDEGRVSGAGGSSSAGAHLKGTLESVQLRSAIMGGALVVFALFDASTSGAVFNYVFGSFLSTHPVVGAQSGTLYEWCVNGGEWRR